MPKNNGKIRRQERKNRAIARLAVSGVGINCEHMHVSLAQAERCDRRG